MVLIRYATPSQNEMNRIKASNNTSGHVGIRKQKDKWTARIKKDSKEIHLGTFQTKEDALHARKKAEEKYFGEYSYDNSRLTK